MHNLDLLKKLLLQEEQEDKERMETSPKTFEDDPMRFILDKYDTLKEIMTELMSEDFEELLTGIYILAYKPTQFKIVLHNGQFFFMTFMGEAYQATVSGKNYFLLNTGEKQRAMLAIARLLRWGSPLKVKGPENAEQGTETSGEETPSETPPAESSETGGEEGGEEGGTLEESKKKLDLEVLTEVVKPQSIARPNTGSNKTSLKEGLVCLFYDVIKNKSLYSKITKVYPSILSNKEVPDPKLLESIFTDLSKIYNANKSNYGTGKSMPENLDLFVKYVFLTKQELDTLTNGISAAEEIHKKINSSGRIIRNESFDKIRAKAVELIKKFDISIQPDNWCPGDVYLVVDKASEAKALKAQQLNIGKDSLNSLFKKTDGIIAISLKEEVAQAGKATTFKDNVFKRSFNAEIKPEEKYGTSDNKNLAKLSASIERFEAYYKGKDKSGKRSQSYKNALMSNGNIHKSVNTILLAAKLSKVTTKDLKYKDQSEQKFYNSNKNIFNNLEKAIDILQSSLNSGNAASKVKKNFIDSRTKFIKDLSKYKIQVDFDNSTSFEKQIEKENKNYIPVLSKKIATYELASTIIDKWSDKNAEISPAYKKIQEITNPFVALTAYAIAEAGISPSFWKVIGSASDISAAHSDFFNSKAIVDIDSKTSKIKLADSPKQSGFVLTYTTILGTEKYLTNLVFRFSSTEIRIEVQKFEKI